MGKKGLGSPGDGLSHDRSAPTMLLLCPPSVAGPSGPVSGTHLGLLLVPLMCGHAGLIQGSRPLIRGLLRAGCWLLQWLDLSL